MVEKHIRILISEPMEIEYCYEDLIRECIDCHRLTVLAYIDSIGSASNPCVMVLMHNGILTSIVGICEIVFRRRVFEILIYWGQRDREARGLGGGARVWWEVLMTGRSSSGAYTTHFHDQLKTVRHG